MKLNSTRYLWLMTGCLLSLTTAFAQQRTPLDIASEHVRTHYSEWNLTEQDVAELYVSDQYTDASTGISRVYFNQRYAGVPVANAILNLSITADGKVFFVGKRFVPNLASKINTTVPVLSAENAVLKAAEAVGAFAEALRPMPSANPQEFLFEKGTFARENVPVKLRYAQAQGKAFLAWDVVLAPVGSHDKWVMKVDAVTGSILDKFNWTVYCNVGENTFAHVDHESENEAARTYEALNFNFNSTLSEENSLSGEQYNVWPPPLESPNHGPRTLVTDPAHPDASPYGWHDTDGAAGAEWTITRGNNVHAYLDRVDSLSSSGDEPDGGADLHFDFPWDPSWEPAQYPEAAVVNLFYMSNYMHDFGWKMGFDEPAGNFQDNTYGNSGQGNDQMEARAQAGADNGSANNAFYSHAPDGASPSINMFIWNGAGGTRFLTVNEPASVEGEYDTNVAGTGWGTGAYVTTTPVTGEVVIVNDGVEEPYSSDGCEEILNAGELVGKIALIDRGGCQFGFKTVAAQEAGAIGVIICNFEDALLSPPAMGPGTVGGNANIPVLFISVIDCQTIRQFAGNGLIVSLVDPGQTGPAEVDGDLDNGIIAHEYGHGISIRLTGGPSGGGCLNNAEQMGEGWSDWMGLVTSVLPGDTGDKKRGIGTYALRTPTNAIGIRRYPYSTDMNLNPLTYSDVAGNPEVHALGEVWTVMVWDLYWAFVEEYGWDADPMNGTGGNNMAVRLVFEGMKTQPCNPGFVDGRNAILAADEALYGGTNQCLIWEVFARRGCGYSADQGDSNDAGDQTEAFDVIPICLNSMLITKSMTDFIEAGDEIEVTIEVGNFKGETVTGVKVNDVIPDGCEYIAGSANVPATTTAGGVQFDLGSMAFTDTKTITYKMATDPNKPSIRKWLDDVPEELSDNWFYYTIGDTATNIWGVTDVFFNSPDFAWQCVNFPTPSRQALELYPEQAWTVEGTRPALRFYHLLETESGVDGGVLDVKEAGTTSWKQVGDDMLRNGYPGFIQYGTFVIPNLAAFSGTTNLEFIPTYVDLSEWAGKDIVLRYRFGTDANTAPDPAIGWVVDDIEFMDLVSYNGEACVTSNQGDNLCAIAPEEGTIVESDLVNSTTEPLKDISFQVYPIPANEQLNIALNSTRSQEVTVSLLTLDGRTVMARSAHVYGNEFIPLDVRSQPAGFYFVKMSTEEGVIVQKVVIE